MNRRKLLLSSLASTAVAANLSGCASPSIDDFAGQKPVLDLRTYFNGMVDAWGIFTDRNGKVVKRFTVEMKCEWQNNQGILDEDFVYADGSKEKRIWKLTDKGNGAFVGTAGDVVGLAEGQTKGNAFNWRYTLALPVDGTVIHVQMDDWMYLMNERVMLNKARMTKLGIHLGDVTLSFTRRA
ncbi:DUF3833 domain-containing protein [Limnohabitans sp.]|uniref:DUF3833 domain-containing protein n=1 Tax=Limnohabitans sp. TaxID=1907725 RepID=UPI002FDCF5D1